MKDVRVGNDAQIHIHMWDKEQRGKGFGSFLFCLAAIEFKKRFDLKGLYCQPKGDNPMPNRMLSKIGFKIVGLVNYPRSDGSFVKQNKYQISGDALDSYLANMPRGSSTVP